MPLPQRQKPINANLSRNKYYCLSSNCSASTGDIIQFIQLKENCNKHEALIKAASLLNGNTAPAAKSGTPAKLIIDTQLMAKEAVLTKLFKYFARALPLTKKAVDYLEDRNIKYKLHEVGCNIGDWHHKLNEKKVAPIREAIEYSPKLLMTLPEEYCR